MPTPDLWRFLRQTISSAIDAPTLEHPDVLHDKDGGLLVFATIEQVLPNPEASWSGEQYANATEVKFGRVDWLGAPKAQEISSNIQKRIDELEPGIADARSQLSETQKLVDQARAELKTVDQDLDLIKKELEADEHDAKSIRNSHTHKLPRAVTDTAKRKSEGGGSSKKSKEINVGVELHSFLDHESEGSSKIGFWKRIFGRRKRAKK
jgi:hypothetical protein